MSMFGGNTPGAFRPTTLFGTTSNMANSSNPMKDFEVAQPPDDSVQALKFSPPALATNFLASGSWDNVVRVWEIKQDGSSEPKAQQTLLGPVFELDWYDDGTKIFVVGADKTVRAWDLGSNQMIQLGQHDQPVKTCHWIKTPSYNLLMTGSWDKTLKLWDPRMPAGNPAATVSLPDRVYCSDVVYPMAVVGLANRQIKIYKLDGTPQEVKQMESPLKFQHRCVSIFKDQKTASPVGFALGSIEGRVAVQLVETNNPKDNFTFKCHRSPELNNGYQDIFAVNDLGFHPVHGTLATVGADGRFSFWDKDARTKLKTSEKMEQAITRCCFNKGGDIFAYAVSYDWSKGHEYFNPQQKNYIFLHPCFEDMKPKPKPK